MSHLDSRESENAVEVSRRSDLEAYAPSLRVFLGTVDDIQETLRKATLVGGRYRLLAKGETNVEEAG